MVKDSGNGVYGEQAVRSLKSRGGELHYDRQRVGQISETNHQILSFFHPTEVNMIPMIPLLPNNNFQVSWESTNQCTVPLNKVRHNKRWLVKRIPNMVWETVNNTKHIKDQFKEWYHITLKDCKQAIWEFLIMIIQTLIIRHEQDKFIFINRDFLKLKN